MRKRKIKLEISKHALLRYLERTLDINIPKIEQKLLQKFPKTVPDGIYKIDGFRFIVRNNTVVTILDKYMLATL